jgi:hypothetical protein
VTSFCSFFLLATHPTSPQTHLGFRSLRCCAAKATSSQSWVCTCNRESRSPESSFPTILHREVQIRFLVAFYVTARSLRQVHHHGLSSSSSGVHRSSSYATHHRPDWAALLVSTVVKSLLSNLVLHTEYADLHRHDSTRDNLLQCLIYFVMIDLSSTCDCTIVLICKSLVIFKSYYWIKIKLKVLLFPTA